jgi:hypothetical protein
VSQKLGAAGYWQADPQRAHQVTIWLYEAPRAEVPSCPDGAPDDRCEARDVALLARQRENADQITCIVEGLGFRLMATPVWYESPFHLTSGEPVPVLVAFNVGLDWARIELAAMNPLVAHIEPPPGEAAVTGFLPEIPSGCPDDSDPGTDTTAKLVGIASVDGKGRKPVVVETVDQGHLPSLCDDGLECQHASWERTILNTREVTCIKRRIDHLVATPSPGVPYATLIGNLTDASLPPLAQAANTLKAFGVGLTFEEGQELARHPYVERLWTDSGIQFEEPVDGCPPDLTKPIPVAVCPAERTAISGKMSEEDQLLFSSGGTMPHDVMIQIAGGAHHCPLEECPDPQSCPARDAVLARYQAENQESQRCVRALIESEGGMSSPEVFWIVNAFAATLTWEQIQVVATHPHVISIDSNAPAPPP